MSKVILRSFNPETDSGLIYDVYPKAVWYGADEPINMSKDDFFREIFNLMKGQLIYQDVHIACMEDNPDTILGFSIIDKGTLEFVFVKTHVRDEGIGTLLIRNKYRTINTRNITKTGAAILRDHPDLLLGETDDATWTTKETY